MGQRFDGRVTKPKLLLLSVSWNYINKTQRYFFDALSDYFEVVRYGPGYVDVDDIEISIFDVLKRVGRTDVVITDELLLFRNLQLENYSALRRINKFYFNLERYIYKE
ncbi:MAG: hypothetical protein OEV45_13290 [Desulfobacteraceae bacterium]|nr:hypothetical protein [Desulfobacteraceae bacterium]